jgi:hypothetical protein
VRKLGGRFAVAHGSEGKEKSQGVTAQSGALISLGNWYAYSICYKKVGQYSFYRFHTFTRFTLLWSLSSGGTYTLSRRQLSCARCDSRGTLSCYTHARTLLVSMSHRGAHCNLKISAAFPYICYLPFTC